MGWRGCRTSLFPSRQAIQNTSLLWDRRGHFAGCFWFAPDFCEPSPLRDLRGRNWVGTLGYRSSDSRQESGESTVEDRACRFAR
jgi:hypothetical protein